jgi:hypothetical protein
MSRAYQSRSKRADNIDEGCITLLQRPDGFWATPGGGHIVNRNHAVKAAENLAKTVTLTIKV